MIRRMKSSVMFLSLCMAVGCAMTSTLVVNTEPYGALVRLSDESVPAQSGPARFVKVPSGEYDVEATLDGYQTAHEQVTLKSGREHETTLILQRIVLPAELKLMTDPPDGTIYIVETEASIQHGEVVQLAAGTYTMKADKAAHDTGQQSVIVRDGEKRDVVVALGQGYRTVVFETRPTGGEIEVVELAKTFKHGTKTRLAAGEYVVKASKPGYETLQENISLSPGLEPQTVTLALGQGYGTLTVTTEPPGGTVKIAELNKAVGHGKEVRLPAGSYTLTASLEGYAAGDLVKVILKAAERKRVTVPLGEGSGDVTITTSDSRASIFFDGKEYPGDIVHVTGLPFGQYEAKGYYRINESTRLVGSKKFVLDQPRGTQVRIELSKKERFYIESWRLWKRSLQQEEADYRKARIAKPVFVNWTPPQETLDQLRVDKNLAAKLHAFLRVGDRVSIGSDEGNWLIWKRGSRPQAEFAAAVRNFAQDLPHESPYTPHDALDLTSTADTLSGLAFDIHRGRVDFPIADLERGLLEENGLILQRSKKDGDVFLLVLGGKGIAVETSQEAPVSQGDLTCFLLRTGSGAFRVDWTSAPRALLAVCDSETPQLYRVEDTLLEAQQGITLKRNQKAIFQLVEGLDVHSNTRFTLSPEGKWRSQQFEKGNSFISKDLLMRGELGPHVVSGDYQSLWIIQWANGGALSQRQVAATYQVNEQSGINEGALFLRRKSHAQE